MTMASSRWLLLQLDRGGLGPDRGELGADRGEFEPGSRGAERRQAGSGGQHP
jgi:hypothetical protein